jgi:hypothetical protein
MSKKKSMKWITAFLTLAIMINMLPMRIMSKGENLVLNPGFEEGSDGLQGWNIALSGGNRGEISTDTEIKKEGNRALKMSVAPGTGETLQMYQGNIPVESLTEYDISLYYFVEGMIGIAVGMVIDIYWYDSGNQRLDRHNSDELYTRITFDPNTADWTRVRIRETAPEGAVKASMYINILKGNRGTGGSLRIDEIIFKEAPPVSSDATLRDLKVDGLSVPDFSPEKTSYDITLPAGTTELPKVTASANHEFASLVITDATTLPGTAEVKVTAEDGITVITYTLNFTVALSEDATLRDLKVNGVSLSGFSPEKTSYTVTLPMGTTEVPAVTAAANHEFASLVITDASELPGTAEVKVTAEDGETTVVYTIHFVISKSLVRNYSFEDGPVDTVEGWTIIHVGAGRGEITIDEEKGKAGSRSLKMSVEPGTGETLQISQTNIPVESLTEYELDFYYLVEGFEGATNRIAFDIYWYDSANQRLDRHNSDELFTTITLDKEANDWTRVRIRETAPEGAVKASMYIHVLKGNRGTGGSLRLDEIIFKEAPPVSSDATLKDLKINGVSVPDFSPEKTSYDITLPAGTTEPPKVTASANHEFASLVITDATTLPGTAEVKVTAEDGITVITYTLNFTVALSEDATLRDLKVNGISLSGFSPEKTSYTVTLPLGTTEIPAVTAAANHEFASLVITDASELPGTAEVKVTAEDGETTVVYTIHFVISKSLVRNYGFEEGPAETVEEWILNLVGSGRGEVSIDEEKAKVGSRSLKMSVEAGTGETLQIYQKDISVESLVDYDINLYYYVEGMAGSTCGIAVDIYWYDSGNNILNRHNSEELYTRITLNANATDWTVAGIRETAPEEAVKASMYIHVLKGNRGTGGSLRIDEIIFKEAPPLSSDATLRDLKINGASIYGFSSDKTSYTVTLPMGTTEIPAVTAAANHEFASLVITDASELPGTAEVKVTAEDGETTVVYTIHFVISKSLVRNYSFEDGPVDTVEGWTIIHVGAGRGEITIDEEKGKAGSRSLKMSVEPGTGETLQISQTNIPVESLTEYELDFYYLVEGFEGATNRIAFDIYWYDSANQRLDRHNSDELFTTITLDKEANDWTRVRIRETAPEGAVKASMYIHVLKGNRGTGGSLRLDEIIFKEAPPVSSDATLKDLKINGVSIPDFSPDKTTYDVVLPRGTEEVPTVTAVANRPNAAVVISDAEELPGTTTITVTSEDNKVTEIYIINFTVSTIMSDDATLKDLKVNGETVQEFSKDKTSYYVILPTDTVELPAIEVSTSHPNATVEVSKVVALPGTATVKVTAEDGETSKIYTIHISMKKSLMVNPGFEEGPADAIQGWILILVGPGRGEAAIDAEKGKEGNRSLRMSVDPGSGETLQIFQGNIPVESLTDYEISLYYCMEGMLQGTAAIAIDIYWYDDGNTLLRRHNSQELFTRIGLDKGKEDWTRVSIRETAPENAVKASMYIHILKGDRGSGGSLWIDDIVFKKMAPIGTNASLQDLKINGVTLQGFDPSVLTYTVEVDTEIPVVTAVAKHLKARVIVTNTPMLPGTTTVKVVAENGTSKTYTIHFTVPSEMDASLRDLMVNNRTVRGFDPSTLVYEVHLPKGVMELPDVKAVANHAGAKTVIAKFMNDDLSGSIAITVTAENGITSRTYIIHFIMEKEDYYDTFVNTGVAGFLSDAFLNSRISAAGKGGTVMTSTYGNFMSVSGEGVKNLGDHDCDLRIFTPAGSMRIPAKVLKSLPVTPDNHVEFILKKVAVPDAGYNMYQIRILVDGQEVRDIDGEIELTLINDADLSLEDVRIIRLNKNGGYRYVTHSAANNRFYFSINGLTDIYVFDGKLRDVLYEIRGRSR